MYNSNFSDKDDHSIWKAFRKGEKSALSFIYFRYAKTLINYGNKICPDKQLVEDKIHDLFVELWSKRDRLGETDSIKFYLFKVLRRKLLEAMKKERRLNPVGIKHISQFSISVESELINLELDDDRKKLLTKLLAQLNNSQRDILHLKYTVGLKNPEIADILEIEHQSVKNNLFRAISKIRRGLEDTRKPASGLMFKS